RSDRRRRDLDDAGPADEQIQRNLIDRDAVLEEVPGCVDVRARMRSEAQPRDVGDVALRDLLRLLDVDGRIAGIDRHARIDRNRDVIDLHTVVPLASPAMLSGALRAVKLP